MSGVRVVTLQLHDEIDVPGRVLSWPWRQTPDDEAGSHCSRCRDGGGELTGGDEPSDGGEVEPAPEAGSTVLTGPGRPRAHLDPYWADDGVHDDILMVYLAEIVRRVGDQRDDDDRRHI